MKIIMITMLLGSFALWAESIKDLGKKIGDEVARDFKKDEERFKKSPSRGPASLPIMEETKRIKIEGPAKIENNIRQIGPREW